MTFTEPSLCARHISGGRDTAINKTDTIPDLMDIALACVHACVREAGKQMTERLWKSF